MQLNKARVAIVVRTVVRKPLVLPCEVEMIALWLIEMAQQVNLAKAAILILGFVRGGFRNWLRSIQVPVKLRPIYPKNLQKLF